MLKSLSNRIFLASALLAVLSIGTALYLVNVVVTRQAEAELEESLIEAGELVTQFQSLFFTALLREARIVADLPKLKAAVDTKHGPTVAPLAAEYLEAVQADVFVVTHRNGSVLSVIGEPGLTPEQISRPADRQGGAGRAIRRRRLVAGQRPAAGRVGADLHRPGAARSARHADRRPAPRSAAGGSHQDDHAQRRRLRRRRQAARLDAAGRRHRGAAGGARRRPRAARDGERRGVRGGAAAAGARDARDAARRRRAGAGGPLAIVARSRTAHLAFLRNLHSALGATTAVAVLIATLLSFAVARTVTRPIRALTATMREMAATGVLTSTPEAPTPTPWDDEDARLLTGTFHSLTVSLDRFQREAAQRERLSSLGRLSTVIAHEIRNPLMIIKGSLRSLRRGVATPEEVAGVATDIEGEVTRLNRVVNDVLDYAKPIALTYDAVEIDRLVRDAAQAVVASQAGPPDVVVEAPEGVTGTTDADRLRQVVINLVTNARDAVLAQRADGVAPASADDAGAPIRVPPPVHVRARLLDDEHVEIAVADRGVGMSDVEVARMFEPFFTTKRRGSGIGLAIAKNIVDGLGGRIDVDSQPGAGTTIRLTLPRFRPAPPSPVTTSLPPASARPA